MHINFFIHFKQSTSVKRCVSPFGHSLFEPRTCGGAFFNKYPLRGEFSSGHIPDNIGRAQVAFLLACQPCNCYVIPATYASLREGCGTAKPIVFKCFVREGRRARDFKLNAGFSGCKKRENIPAKKSFCSLFILL